MTTGLKLRRIYIINKTEIKEMYIKKKKNRKMPCKKDKGCDAKKNALF